MKKQEFLDELRKRIDMLEDAEQQDILAEYAQHIDLRMDGGLSEEDAIKDFGDFDQLVSEILAAYHVKPDVHSSAHPSLPSLRPLTDRCRSVWDNLGSWLKTAGASVSAYCCRTGHAIRNWFSVAIRKIKSRFHRHAPTPVTRKPERADHSRFTAFRSGLGRFMDGLGRFCLLLLRLCWNLGLLLCAAPILMAALALMMGLGISVVLVCQGFPFLGIVLATLGILSICLGLLGLGWTLIWHRPGKEKISYENAD